MLRQTKVSATFVVLAKGGERSEGVGGCGSEGGSGEGAVSGRGEDTDAGAAEEGVADNAGSREESMWYQCTASVKGWKGVGAYG